MKKNPLHTPKDLSHNPLFGGNCEQNRGRSNIKNNRMILDVGDVVIITGPTVISGSCMVVTKTRSNIKNNKVANVNPVFTDNNLSGSIQCMLIGSQQV